jgi:disulfide bond formation protein DsbB
MTMRQSLRAERTARLAGAVSLALIAGALGFQYIIHLAPCEMCHWQRWPHIAAAVIGLVVVALWKAQARALAWLCVLLIAVSGGVAAYQTGMQLGILPGPAACTVAHAYVMGSNAPPPEVSCNLVTWSLFGLSLAAYNAIISLFTAALGALLLVRK